MKTAIFDLDGTLALIEHRRHLVTASPPNWTEFNAQCGNDEPNEPIIEQMKMMREHGWKIFIFSARSEEAMDLTKEWLRKNVAENAFWQLRMRPRGIYLRDDLLKMWWLAQLREEGFDVKIAFDDRQQVVDMWRLNGVTCCQVAPSPD